VEDNNNEKFLKIKDHYRYINEKIARFYKIKINYILNFHILFNHCIYKISNFREINLKNN
jgi:hypothetical protein